ncbi:hypothetical protein AB6A40_001188 [Gnathostoma spinigerum]|uniref:C2 domain-containing protein n=1 Tax=Gnathostoma spinigerum TaxID=75299 RepID=A0ABD6EAV4_9BILA
MYIPCGGEKLPARLSIRVLAARNLPIMDKSNDTTDAFVEVHFANQVFKTEICSKSLSPVWNSDEFVFETNEQQICDGQVQFRIMDYDTYSANDAIGRVFFDVSMMVGKIRKIESSDAMKFSAWLPIYDTIYGIRGDLHIYVSLQLLVSRAAANYVQILSANSIPEQYDHVQILGHISDIHIAPDQEYQWIDRIRTPRASNEARLSIIRNSLRELSKRVAQKAYAIGANAIFGYKEFVDIEGDSSKQLCFRVFGTAVRIHDNCNHRDVAVLDKLLHPIISLSQLPTGYIYGSAAVVSVRAVHLLDDEDCSIELRKKWWNELKVEMLQQTATLSCNMIVGYMEQVAIRHRIAILSCTGTAVLGQASLSDSCLPCATFHVPYSEAKLPFTVHLGTCATCKNSSCPDMMMSTCTAPQNSQLYGTRHALQVSVIKKITCSESDDEQSATEISHALPFLEHELHNSIISEARSLNAQCNAICEIATALFIKEDYLVAVATAVICRPKALMRENGPNPTTSAPSFSLTSLQRVTDARRFSWGSMRDAMRFRNTPSLTSPFLLLHVLHLRTPMLHAVDQNQRQRRRMEKIVNRFRRKTGDRDIFSKMIFEKQISLQLGVIGESTSSSLPSNSVAGLHILNSGTSFSIIKGNPSTPEHHISSLYTSVFIRENVGSTKDTDAVNSLIESAFDEAIYSVRVHAEAIGACGMSSFRVASAHLVASKDQAHIVLLISADLQFSVS